ncbi:MAG: hypothetical protein V4729_07050 [Pseudomonadota bacterium]
MNKSVLAAGLVAAGLLLGGGAWWWTAGGGGNSADALPVTFDTLPTLVLPDVDAESLSGFDEREKAIILQLRKKYGAAIAGVPLQLEVIANLRDLLQKLYPQDWQQRLLRILAAAFPVQASELLDVFARLLRYEEWLEKVLPHMQFDSAEARSQIMWAKRVELFGEAAYQIWAVELREQKLREQLKDLGQSTAPFQDKSKSYIEALRATYGDRVIGPEAPHLTQNLGRFLELGSVQQDLKSLPVQERQQRLREFRAAMGLDEAALKRWDELDAERDIVRSAGDTYMAERTRLEALPPGPERDVKLQALQDRLFGAEAAFIRNEEASGHYRFKTPQTLGVN